jgi:hypothetical protein
VSEGVRRQLVAFAVLQSTDDREPNEDQPVPMIATDGCAMSWDGLTRMVAAFGGWPLKLEFRDRRQEGLPAGPPDTSG